MVTNASKNSMEKYFTELAAVLDSKRYEFMKFLQMSEDELLNDPGFLKFLVMTTNELLQRQEELLSLARTMAATDRGEPGNTAVTGGRVGITLR